MIFSCTTHLHRIVHCHIAPFLIHNLNPLTLSSYIAAKRIASDAASGNIVAYLFTCNNSVKEHYRGTDVTFAIVNPLSVWYSTALSVYLNSYFASIFIDLLSFPYAFYFALQLLIVSSIMESYYITPLCSATFVSNYIKSLPKFRDNCYTFMLFNYCNQAHFDIY